MVFQNPDFTKYKSNFAFWFTHSRSQCKSFYCCLGKATIIGTSTLLLY